MHGLSAAHKTLPIPSYARVTNLSNGRSVVVRINDRGPYIAGRMLDVSARVARLLAYHGGMERVRLDYLGMAGPEGADDQRALLASLKTGDEPVAVAHAKPADDGVSVAARSAPALAFAEAKPRAPAAAALEAAVRPIRAGAVAPIRWASPRSSTPACASSKPRWRRRTGARITPSRAPPRRCRPTASSSSRRSSRWSKPRATSRERLSREGSAR